MEATDGGNEPAVRHQHVSTADPELAADVLRETYRVGGGVWIAGVTDGFHFSQDVLDAGDFAVTRSRTSATVTYQGPLEGLLCVEQVHGGRLSIDTSTGGLRTGAGDVCLIPPHGAWRAVTEDVDLAPLILDRDMVASQAAAICGTDPGPLVFHGVAPVSRAAANYWSATVAHVRRDVLGNPDTVAVPLIRAETFRMLATGVLTTFPNNAVEALAERPAGRSRGAEPATVKRAAEFIDANAHLPVGITEIAEAARIGARGLQYNFRRYRDCTPLEYLRRVRLAGAHDDLLAADPTRGDSVAAIAARWGFTNPGRFAAEYRLRNGRPPGETLRA